LLDVTRIADVIAIDVSLVDVADVSTVVQYAAHVVGIVVSALTVAGGGRAGDGIAGVAEAVVVSVGLVLVVLLWRRPLQTAPAG
jgi:hypothetical protein